MIAADTNVVLRLLTGDDERQVAIVLAVIEAEMLFVPITVTLEAEWVLRSYYRWSREQIADALFQLMQLDGIVIAEAAGIEWALDGYARGCDFTDLIHIVAAGDLPSFATFDRGVARYAIGSKTAVLTLDA